MLFGGVKKAEKDSDEEVTVDGYRYFGQLFYSMFRLTMVDEYDYDVSYICRLNYDNLVVNFCFI